MRMNKTYRPYAFFYLIALFSFFYLQPLQGMTPEMRKKLFDESIINLKSTGIEKNVPGPYSIFPDIALNNVKLSELVKSGPVLLTFYRGGWCPYCVKQLKEMQERQSEVKKMNITIFAVSPENKSEVAKTKAKNGLNFELLSDHDNSLARELKLVFEVDEEVVKVYQGFGINLELSNGNKKNELPIPATYLIGKNLKVLYAYIEADYRKRALFDDVLKAAANY